MSRHTTNHCNRGAFTGFPPKHLRFRVVPDLVIGAVLLAAATIAALAEEGDLAWARRLGGTVDDECTSLAVDASGSVYITGRFWTAATFGPGPGSGSLTAVGSRDIFVVKLDASGAFVWARSMGGLSDEGGTTIAVDSGGNVYIGGYFYGEADFDPGAGTTTLTPIGGVDFFLCKLDGAGNFVWAKQFGAYTGTNVFAIALSPDGNVHGTGDFRNTVDFDPGAGTFELTSSGGADVFVVTLDDSGSFLWAKQLGGTSSDRSTSIATDPGGNVCTAGYFNGTADFDPDPGETFNLTPTGTYNSFVSKLDSSGDFVFAKLLGEGGHVNCLAIATDSAGSVYTTGSFGFTADFDPGAGDFDLTAIGGGDVFISKLDSSGNFGWARSIGNGAAQEGRSLAVDANGAVWTTGHFHGTLDFDPGPGTFFLDSSGSGDIFVSKLDGSGDFLDAIRFGGGSLDNGWAVAVDGEKNAHVAGRFMSTIDFDPGAETFDLQSLGYFDAFIVKLSGEADVPGLPLHPIGTICMAILGTLAWFVTQRNQQKRNRRRGLGSRANEA